MAKRKIKLLPFARCLVLNRWLLEQMGFDLLTPHTTDAEHARPLSALADKLRDCQEGMDNDNLHYFYKTLDADWKQQASITRSDLLRYEHNIVSHTLAINVRRIRRPIVWKYYQWLSLLFAEIYLDKYFNQRDFLLRNLNKYVREFNQYWDNKNYQTGITPYTLDDLNKICLQNATGSGKTLLMHVNFLQFRHYVDGKRFKNQLSRTILITPNENLSAQHARELMASSVGVERLSTDGGDLLSSGKHGLGRVDFTEITKLSLKDGPNQIAIRNLGDQNLLLVDEAHRGMGSSEETGWFKSRERLAEKGFVFEYSATFKEAITAANNSDIEAAYAKNILFDYSYRYFYADGYGKDYRIFNLSESYGQKDFTYLTACLLSFYQQLKLYEDKKIAFKDYNLEKPLWVFVGKSVSKSIKTKDEKKTVSDVALILQFIAQLLKNDAITVARVADVLGQNAEATGLADAANNDIFKGSFLYINDLLSANKWNYRELLRDIFSKVFLNSSGGQLNLAKIKGSDNEIMLRVGQADTPFGLINVGDAGALIKHIETEKEKGINLDILSNLNVGEADFSEALFGQVHNSSSPVTMLLGSKKFVEGWDCWRVSTLGLMHVGRSEGAQIIQLFGRGVRLKGYDWTLKRSYFSTPAHSPKYIQYLETLNVFGVKADFMDRFKKFLEEEGLPGNDQKVIYEIPLTVTYNFGKKLKVLRPRRKDSDGTEYDFKRDARVVTFGNIPEKLQEKIIQIDWYPRIQSLQSIGDQPGDDKNKTHFSHDQITFLDNDDLFFKLEKFKRERKWYNLNIDKNKILELLENATWYTLIVPSDDMDKNKMTNLKLWQAMASELLLKYCDELYNYSKDAFIEPRLELRALEREDENIPSEEKYQLIVDSNEAALIQDIKRLSDDINNKKTGILRSGDLQASLFDTHLYQPVISVKQKSEMQILPVSLNESEFKFVQNLMAYLNKSHEGQGEFAPANGGHSGVEFYLLRNQSKSKGIGFFEAGSFYPDFLLWKIEGDYQSIAFIDPHGLQHTGVRDKKIEFHKTIKNIQNRLEDKKVCLNSFIVTPSRYAHLRWEESIDELREKHVLFMNDNEHRYIADIVERMTA